MSSRGELWFGRRRENQEDPGGHRFLVKQREVGRGESMREKLALISSFLVRGVNLPESLVPSNQLHYIASQIPHFPIMSHMD